MINHSNTHCKSTKGHIATDETFDDFLNEQGLLADAEELAIKELIAEQLRMHWKRCCQRIFVFVSAIRNVRYPNLVALVAGCPASSDLNLVDDADLL